MQWQETQASSPAASGSFGDNHESQDSNSEEDSDGDIHEDWPDVPELLYKLLRHQAKVNSSLRRDARIDPDHNFTLPYGGACTVSKHALSKTLQVSPFYCGSQYGLQYLMQYLRCHWASHEPRDSY